MTKPDISPGVLRQLLRYDADSGKLFWRERGGEWFSAGRYPVERSCRSWNTRYSGKEAFTADDGRGYRHGAVLDRKYQAHRVIWAMVTGAWPADQIDHINGNPSDNRMENLRPVSALENSRNKPVRSDNKTGVVGVSWDTRSGRWQAKVKAEGRQISLGYFKDFAAAVEARMAAEAGYGYHENHGRLNRHV